MGDAVKEERYRSFRLSPDGLPVALSKVNDAGALNIFRFEFTRQVLTRFTLMRRTRTCPCGHLMGHGSLSIPIAAEHDKFFVMDGQAEVMNNRSPL